MALVKDSIVKVVVGTERKKEVGEREKDKQNKEENISKTKLVKKHTQERERMNKIAKTYFSMTEK